MLAYIPYMDPMGTYPTQKTEVIIHWDELATVWFCTSEIETIWNQPVDGSTIKLHPGL